MTSSELLSEMRKTDIRTVNRDTLKDLRDVKINPSFTAEEKAVEYLKQIKNPYCYKHGKYVIKITYTENGGSLNERLESYLRAFV